MLFEVRMLDFKKDLFAVKKVHKQPYQKQGSQGLGHSMPWFGQGAVEPLKQKAGSVVEIYKSVGQIDGQGVDADHLKKERPPSITQYVDDIVEQRHG